MDRIRQRLPTEVDTAQLIEQLATARLDNEAARPVTDEQSTTTLLNTDLKDHNVSQSTMLIRGAVPVTPERRPVSGSSLDLLSFDHDETDDDEQEGDYDDLQKHKDYEIDLDHFHFLLTKLPNSLSIYHFISIVSNYVKSLQQHHINISSDRFIITIFNQLRHPDFELQKNGKMIKIIDIFLNHPANEAMKLANFLYFNQVHNKKKLYLKLWLIKFRKFEEIEKSSKVWQRYLVKKHFNMMLLKFEVYSNDLESNALIFNNIKKKLKYYELWKFKFDKIQNLNEIVTLHKQAKVFSKWTNKIKEDYSKAEDFKEKVLSQRCLKIWKLKNLATKNESFIKSNLSFALSKWKSKHQQLILQEKESKVLELVLTGGHIFTKWNQITKENISKDQELNSKYESFLLQKYTNVLKHSLLLKSIENKVIPLQKKSLLKVFFKFWLQRNNESIKCKTFQINKLVTKKALFLKNWKTQIELKKKISEFESANKLKKFLRIWKLKTVSKVYQQNNRFNDLKLSRNFKNWLKFTKLQKSLNDYNQTITQCQFENWRSKKDYYSKLWELSQEANVSFVLLRFLKYWHNRYKINESELQNRLTYFRKKKIFNRIKLKFKRLSEMNEKATRYFETNSSDSIRSKILNKWYSNYQKSVEIKLSNRLEIYKVEKTLNIRRNYFDKWKSKNDLYPNKLKEFDQDKLQKLVLPNFMQIWISKFQYLRDMEIEANEINKLNLLSSGFNKLQLKLVQINELNNTLDSHDQDTDLKLIIKFLNIWSLKLLKAKRDNENINSFKNRWDRAHLRAILLLWKGKLNEVRKQDEFNTFDEIEYSPTIFRTSNLNQLNTPVKSINTFTGNAGGDTAEREDNVSIPGSERIKRQRREALKSRYNRVRYAVPSPLKDRQSLIETQTPVLSSSTVPNLTSTSTSSRRLKFVNNKPQRFNVSPTSANFENDSDLDYSDEPLSSPIISHRNLFNYGNTRKYTDNKSSW